MIAVAVFGNCISCNNHLEPAAQFGLKLSEFEWMVLMSVTGGYLCLIVTMLLMHDFWFLFWIIMVVRITWTCWLWFSAYFSLFFDGLLLEKKIKKLHVDTLIVGQPCWHFMNQQQGPSRASFNSDVIHRLIRIL